MTKNTLSNVDYWKSRQNQTWNSLEKDEAKLLKKLDKLYADQSADLTRDIAVYFGKYAKNDVIAYRDLLQSLGAADKKLLFERFDAFATKYPEYAYLLPIRESIYRLDRLEGLQYNIRLAQLEVGASEQTALNKHLLDTYTGTYGRFAKELGLGMVDKQTAQLLINADWTGAGNYSSSIWSNRDKLAKYLANDVRNAFIRGDNYAKIAKAMEERFSKVSKADIRRLVYTEGTYVANMAMMAPFEESGLYDEYEYVAVIDGSTSDVCRGLDGQKYKIADKMPGINFPPMHPRCRSTFLIVMPDEKNLFEEYLPKQAEEKVSDSFPFFNKNVIVLRQERLEHILEGHKDIGQDVTGSLRRVIKQPDKILIDHKNKDSILVLGRGFENNINIAVKLSTNGYDNSIITAMRVSDKTIKRILKKNIKIYDKDR
ncbi:TPA: minor capsid protein [Streptococcus suis]